MMQAFVICREIYEAHKSKDLALVAPFSAFTRASFPARLQFSVYAHLTEARGRYAMRLQVEDSEGQVVWSWDLPNPVEESDPLRSHRIGLSDIVVEFPSPGRYNVTISANMEVVAQHYLLARLGTPA